MGKKKDRSLFPPVPGRLEVPIVDNHTHVGTDRPGQTQNRSDTGEPRYPLLIDGQLETMAEAGISHAITVGCSIPDLDDVIELARTHPSFFSAAIAIHPNDAAVHAGILESGPDGLTPTAEDHHRLSLDEAIGEVADRAGAPEVVAIGETGLDYFRTSESGIQAQKESFRAHVALAKELDKPLQIHDRDAHRDTVELLLAEGAPDRTVFHCFSGDRELAEILAENGWYASFAGPATFPANDALRQALRAMPSELILVETDAPYLTPAPYRGRPNAPYLAGVTAEFMASQRGSDVADFCHILNKNTRRVYGDIG